MHIAIIGGGFCGTMAALNLLHKAQKPLQITLIEKSTHAAKGTAYSTKDYCHLLNVRADRMGAFAGDPAHFLRWLQENEEEWRKKSPYFESLKIDPEGYLPRMLYGCYLEDLLSKGLQKAKNKNIPIVFLAKEVVDLKNRGKEIELVFSDGSILEADQVLLALGIPPNKNLVPSHFTHPGYISNAWALFSDEQLFSNVFKNFNRQTHVVIIGTGLTMFDVMASFVLRGFCGRMTVISPHGNTFTGTLQACRGLSSLYRYASSS